MEIINFIINNILTQAGITLALIALLGLILQKKSFEKQANMPFPRQSYNLCLSFKATHRRNKSLAIRTAIGTIHFFRHTDRSKVALILCHIFL